MAVARTLLESTSRSIQAISCSVGYEDTAYFRKLFRRETGLTPGEYRRRFSIIPGTDKPATSPESAH